MVSIVKLKGNYDIPHNCNVCPLITCATGDDGDYIERCLLQWDEEACDYKDVHKCCLHDKKDEGCPIISIEKVEAE